MQLKQLRLLFIVVSALTACSSGDRKFKISGNIAGMPQQTVVLEQWNANDMIVIVDSVHSKADGHFELSGIAPEMGLYRLDFQPDRFILLTIDKGNVKIDANWNKIEEYNVSGSPASDDLKNILAAIRQFTHDNITMSIVFDTLKARGNDSMLTVARNEFTDKRQHFTQFLEHYADTCSYEPNAIFTVRMLSIASEKYFLDAFSQSLNRRFPGTKMTHDYMEWYTKAMERQKQPAKSMETGMMAPEVALQDVDGAPVTLSSFKGKYVLLDFWASWCGPCREENPNVVAAYRRFKGKNFTVLGVSLDNQKSAWERAIAEDSLAWTQVSDLKGWNSAPVLTYGVHSIPANFLIDPSGKIIARNLRGSHLEETLQEVLRNPAATTNNSPNTTPNP